MCCMCMCKIRPLVFNKFQIHFSPEKKVSTTVTANMLCRHSIMEYEAFHCKDQLKVAAGKVPHIVKLLHHTAVSSSEPTTHNRHEAV